MSDNIRLILKYLKDNGNIQSFLTLQKQSNISLFNYSKQLQFFKTILLKGDFTQCLNFISTFQSRIEDTDYKKIVLLIYKQKLYELIDNPNQQQLKALFQKELINYSSQQQFQEMFNYLTYRSVNQIEGLEYWTVIKGRYQCFQKIMPYLEMFNSVFKNQQIEQNLEYIIEYYRKNRNKEKEKGIDTYDDVKNRYYDMNKKEKKSLEINNYKQSFIKVKQNKPDKYDNYDQNDREEDQFQLQRQDKNINKIKNISSINNANDQKQLVKSNIMKMNLSNNYSSIKDKNMKESNFQQPKKQLQNQSIKKDNNLQQKNISMMSNISNASNIEKRSRVNASLAGSMNINNPKQKIQHSVKMDNYMKQQPKYQQNNQISMKKSNLNDKYQINNQSNININQSNINNNQSNFKNNQSNINNNPSNIINNLSNMSNNKSNIVNNNVSNLINNKSNINPSLINQSSYQKPYNDNMYNQSKLSSQNPSKYSKKVDKKQLYSTHHDHINNINVDNIQHSHLNQISQQQATQSVKSIKNDKKRATYNYMTSQDEDLQQQIKKNIQYLQQTNSVVYNNKSQIDQQHFTFQQKQIQKQQDDKIKMITKLAVISDNKAIRTCKFSQSGNLFAIGTNSSILKIFDVKKIFQKNKLNQISPIYQIDNLHQKSIFCLDWSKNQKNIITCSNDMNIKISQINNQYNDHKTAIIGKHQSCIRMVKFSQNQSRIYSCGDDSVIKVWDIGKNKKCTNLKGHTNSVSSIKIHNDNDLYSVSKDMTIKRWDLRLNQCVFTSKPQNSQLTYIANNTDKIVVSHKNGCVSFMTESLQLSHSVQIHQQEIRSIQALKGQNVYLTASFDGYLAIFSEINCHIPNYFQHNDAADDKVVYANFLHSSRYKGFSSTSTQGLCHIYSYQ